VVILRETLVHLVFVRILVLTGHRPKTWVVVKWYFSGKDIAEHELRKSGIRMYVSTAPQGLSPVKLRIRDTSSYGKFERSPSQDHQVISIQSINGNF
jgi:hypothetical protein